MKQLIILTAFLFFPVWFFAQVPANDCHTSTEGTDFWFGFMQGRDLKNIHFLEIVVTAREATTFTITYGPGETEFGGIRQVGSDVPTRIVIPWELVEHFTSEIIENKGIHLKSVKPVNVYALNWDQNSNDVAVIYPIKSLGTEYYAMCYTPSAIPTDNGKNTEFLIVATEDETKIKITPSVNTHENRHLKGNTYEINLNRGQSYQVQSLNNNNWPGQGDLTGSYILSDKPIALFSGSLIAMIPPASPMYGTGDHLFEQIPPVYAWGREFLTVPYKTRFRDRLRILSKEDHTIVWINGLKPDTLDRGEFKDTVLLDYQPKRIIAEKPILIAQYSQSASEDLGEYAGGNNEPFMTILSPVAQYRNSANFAVYPAQQYANYFINAVFPNSQRPHMYLDGVKLEDMRDDKGESLFHQHANNYSFIQYHFDTLAQNKIHNIWTDDPDGGFYAYSYSYGLQESFGYGVAFNLDNLLDLGSSINFQMDTLLLCYGDTITLDAGWWFKEFEWNTGDTTQIIAVADSGWYSVQVKDAKGCPQEDSVYVFLSKPVADLIYDNVEGCQPFSLNLDGGEKFRKYYWSNGERTRRITVDTTGVYSVIVENRYGCQASDSMRLTVFPTPKINLLADNTICDTLEADIEVKLSYFNSLPWDLPLETKWYAENQNVTLSDTTETTVHIS
ncbi:MAG: IgGFc-binding protein, partial [Prolixibacteraceae bacterium]|nr:IgGFc-binding protein [Prolixibacteraceae bacterium]